MSAEQDTDALLRFQAIVGEWHYLAASAEMIGRRRAELAAMIGADAAEFRTNGDADVIATVEQVLRSHDWVDTEASTEARLRGLEGQVADLTARVTPLLDAVEPDPLPVPTVRGI